MVLLKVMFAPVLPVETVTLLTPFLITGCVKVMGVLLVVMFALRKVTPAPPFKVTVLAMMGPSRVNLYR